MKKMDIGQALELARKYHEKGDFNQAEQVYRAIIEIDPFNAEATHNLGMLAAAKGNREEALILVKKSIELERNNPNYHNNLGELYRLMGQLEHAQFHLSAACELKPGFSEAFSNLGIVYMTKGEIANAKFCFSEALSANPTNIAALINTGNLFRKTGETDDALQCYDAALAISEDHPTALSCIAGIYKDKGEYNTAAKFLSRVVNNNPDSFNEKLALAEITLINKDFRKGLQLYESRLNLFKILQGDRDSLWRGTGQTDRTLYIYFENTPISSYGQTLLALRYLYDLERFECNKIVVYLQPEVAELIKNNLPDYIEVVTEPCTEFDKHIPLMSLPMVLNARAKTIPLADGYIKVDAAEVQSDKKKIGHALKSYNDKWSAPADSLKTLKDNSEIELFDLNEGTLADKASKIAAMDMVITTDNDVAHMAGAMGVKTCLLIDKSHHWHWFNAKNEKTCEWYSSVIFYLKDKGASWLDVISSIKGL